MWVKERRKLKRFCDDCRKIFEENPRFKGKSPRCDQCFPGVTKENLESWEVFQRYSAPMGADSDAIFRLAERMGVNDPLEVMEKVLCLLGEVDRDG